MTEIMILGMLRIASKFHFKDHLLKMTGKNLGFLIHKNYPFCITSIWQKGWECKETQVEIVKDLLWENHALGVKKLNLN